MQIRIIVETIENGLLVAEATETGRLPRTTQRRFAASAKDVGAIVTAMVTGSMAPKKSRHAGAEDQSSE